MTDQAGQPVRAQVSLAVIDEAVYGVKADDTPDPLRFFYRREYTRVGTTFSREYYFTGYSGRERLQLARRKRRPFTLADFKGDKPVQPQVRKDFPDAIYWVGDLVTDAQGRGRIAVTYPDALTTWRLTARAITDDTGPASTIARTTTTKDLIVRVITPRFLTEGDEVVVPTIVHNYLPEPRTASVSIAGDRPRGCRSATPRRDQRRARQRRANGATTGASPRKTPAPRPSRRRRRPRATATPWSCRFPVLPYGLRREVGTSGSIVGAGEATADGHHARRRRTRRRASISVALAPSLAGSLLGALDFLTAYPYGCTEQTLSSFLPNLLVTRALTELKLAPTERLSALDRQVSAGLQRLYDYQHDDGGWGWWKTDGNHPFMTAYALWGLDEARRAGVKVDDYRISNGARALAQLYADLPARRARPQGLRGLRAAARRRRPSRRSRWYADGAAQVPTRTPRRATRCGTRAAAMSAYGRALLLLLLDEAKDPRGNELARR